MNTQHKKAFTLVELLVVIAIIGILVSLLLPAVQSAREAARRSSCINKLKQLSLGALNYSDTYGYFPISNGFSDAGAANSLGERHSCAGWILSTLPFLEEQVLYDQFKEGGAFEGQYLSALCSGETAIEERGLASTKNGIVIPELMKLQMPFLQCPSEPSSSELSTDQFDWKDCSVGLTNYKGVIGDTLVGEGFGASFANDGTAYPSGTYEKTGGPQRDCHRDTRCRGMFFRVSFRKPIKMSSITDGTSKTLLIGEDIAELSWHSTHFYSDHDWASANVPLNWGVSVQAGQIESIANEWVDTRGFRSRHPGGVSFARADGSVTYLSETIDNLLYRTSCTRNGDEIAIP